MGVTADRDHDLEKVHLRNLKVDRDIRIEKANDVGIYKRRKMLRKVMVRLYEDLQLIKESKTSKRYKRDEIEKEMRLRAYKITSNLMWEKFEQHRCNTDTQAKVQHIIDFCKDNLKKELHFFEVYSKHYTSTLTEKLLLKLSGLPLLGRLFYHKLVAFSFARYDLLLTISDSLSEVLDSEQFLRDEFADWKKIRKELRIQLNSFERARDLLLRSNPKLVCAVQTKKAGSTILNFGFHMVHKLHHSGEIDDMEKKALLAKLDAIYRRLGSVQYYIKRNPPMSKGRAGAGAKDKGEDKGAQGFTEVPTGASEQEIEKNSFKRKISILFPFLKELTRPELEHLHSKVVQVDLNASDAEMTLPEKLPLGSESKGFVYMVKFGMLRISASSWRVVEYMSNADFMGLFQLFAKDVSMRAKAVSDTRFYRVEVEVIEQFMQKYPFLEKTLYQISVINYLKICSSKVAHTKSKYFRRLRRLSTHFLNNIFDAGEVLRLGDNQTLLNYMYDHHLSSMGVFVLKGALLVRHTDPYVQKVRQMFKIEDIDLVVETIKKRHAALKAGRDGSDGKKRKRLDENYYSKKRFTENDHSNEEVVRPGNGTEIHPDFLEGVELQAPEVVIFVLEKKVGQTGKGLYAEQKSQRRFGINRRRTHI